LFFLTGSGGVGDASFDGGGLQAVLVSQLESKRILQTVFVSVKTRESRARKVLFNVVLKPSEV
jgi:hypothetical protein